MGPRVLGARQQKWQYADACHMQQSCSTLGTPQVGGYSRSHSILFTLLLHIGSGLRRVRQQLLLFETAAASLTPLNAPASFPA